MGVRSSFKSSNLARRSQISAKLGPWVGWLVAVCGVQFLDVLGEARQFLLGEFVATGGTKKGGKRALEDDIIRHIRRSFAPLKRRFVHESQLRSTSEAEEIRQAFQEPNVTRGGFTPRSTLLQLLGSRPTCAQKSCRVSRF